jgi:acetyl-CoA synthetase
MSFEIVNNQYNIAYYCTQFQCEQGFGDKTAFRWMDAKNNKEDFSFNQLNAESSRYANVFSALGLGKGDVVFTFLPKMPEQFFAFLGLLKMQAVVGTLFSNFGEDALCDRLVDACATMVVTKKSLLKKILPVMKSAPALRYVLLVDTDAHDGNILSLPLLLKEASETFSIEITSAETPSVLHYTSGSTGKPKGVQHIHKSILSQSATAEKILSLQSSDIYWCTADQGWVTGTSYGIIGPWSLGVTQIHFGGAYDAARWMQLIQDEKVNVWYTAPTALRMLMREEREMYKSFDLGSLRDVFSVGEPLNPEINVWAKEVFNKEIYDTWFQTETGSIMVSNRPNLAVKPGSMGKPMDGIEAEIVDEKGEICPINEHGNLCIKAPWPSMFITYLNNPSVYQSKFKNGFYYSGDLAYKDANGYFFFLGRNDDVINTAGHLISPFEVESALLEFPEIAESAVIGAKDEVLFEKVVAYIRLKEHVAWDDDLEMRIRLRLSNKLSSIATPQDIKIIDEIPKNKSGKILRRVLKAWYNGEDPGDISTMEI